MYQDKLGVTLQKPYRPGALLLRLFPDQSSVASQGLLDILVHGFLGRGVYLVVLHHLITSYRGEGSCLTLAELSEFVEDLLENLFSLPGVRVVWFFTGTGFRFSLNQHDGGWLVEFLADHWKIVKEEV